MFFVLLAAVLPLSVHAQQVTLHLQDVTVRKAFRELEVKGNVSLVYEKNDVDLTITGESGKEVNLVDVVLTIQDSLIYVRDTPTQWDVEVEEL